MTQTGTLIAVVGPSGVGKDSVIDAVSDRLGIAKVRRVITRDAALGGETFTPVSVAAFKA